LKKRKAGRPKRDLIYKLRTQVWLDAVSMESGKKTPTELELLFSDPDGTRKHSPGNRPGLWAKYRKGKVCPTIESKTKGKLSIVDRVELIYPGTAAWIKTPLWDLLTSKPMSMDDLKLIYWSLGPAVQDLIVTEPSIQYPQFWRTQEDLDVLCDELLELKDIRHTLSAILCLVREAKLKQSIDDFEIALHYWIRCEDLIDADPILRRYSDDIISAIGDMVQGDEDYW
jgi:hypothetical protein